MVEEEISVLGICKFGAHMKATKGNTLFKDYSDKQQKRAPTICIASSEIGFADMYITCPDKHTLITSHPRAYAHIYI